MWRRMAKHQCYSLAMSLYQHMHLCEVLCMSIIQLVSQKYAVFTLFCVLLFLEKSCHMFVLKI